VHQPAVSLHDGRRTVTPSSESILVDKIPADFGTHNAGDVHVAKDGNLYVSVGDGGGDYAGDSGSGAANDAARDMHALVGTILRITREGGIPADNPSRARGRALKHLRRHRQGPQVPGDLRDRPTQSVPDRLRHERDRGQVPHQRRRPDTWDVH
jgi:Glucose / Sorbosone dehydrogenase